MKRFVISAIALIAAVMAYAQQPLPNDPAVKTGKLENGMTYYIRHNAIPEGRAEFYLATDVGAIQETPDQDGLAHFLEHMCFNGLKNLPGKQMLDYLQNIGAEFGRNINASTGVEQTQYMLNNMPISREGIIDTCLLVMHDYSHFVLLEQEEIDAERGVILEEKRTRNNASWRMFEKSAPIMYGPSSKYANCNIIGSEENLKTFKRESIVNFYETWYRPDMQAIIVVGDIDVEQIYNKIVKLFADIPAPVNPQAKVMPEVEINDEPVVGILTDPELTSTEVEFLWKLGKPLPKQLRGTDLGYVQSLIKNIFRSVMAERFEDITSKPGAPFLDASLYVSNLCATCEAVSGSVTCENAKVLESATAYLIEIEKVKRYGVTDDEVDRVKDDLLTYYKNRVSGADTRKNPEFIRPILNNFFRGTSYMAPETEYQIVQMILGQLNAAVINQMIPALLTGEHLTIIYNGVDKEGQVHPTEAQLLECVQKAKEAEIAAPVAEQFNKDFMQGKKLKGGKVKKEVAGDYGSTVWTLSNGMKVVVKPTDFKKDQVIFRLSKEGGLSLVPTEDMDSFNNTILQTFSSTCGIGQFPSSTVSKMLSGKTVRVSPFIGQVENGVSGSCDPSDIETALQLSYLYFVDPRFDKDEWAVAESQLSSVLPNMLSTPDYAFYQHLYATLYNSPRMKMVSPEILEKANLETYEKYYRKMFSDISGATLYICGNVDLETLKPLVEKYCGSMPKGKKALGYNEQNMLQYTKGEVNDVFKVKMTTPKVRVLQVYTAELPYTVQKDVDLNAANFILDMIYTATLREEEGGTYGASSRMSLSYYPKNEAIIQTVFDTNVDQQEKLRLLAIKGIKELAQNGPTEEHLGRAIENAKKNLPEQRINNSYWMNTLRKNAQLGIDADKAYEQAIANISAEGIKSVLQEILSQNNFLEVVMTPEE